jgi:hypothetical protein
MHPSVMMFASAESHTWKRAGVKSPCKESYNHLNVSCRFSDLHTRLVARPQERDGGCSDSTC